MEQSERGGRCGQRQTTHLDHDQARVHQIKVIQRFEVAGIAGESQLLGGRGATREIVYGFGELGVQVDYFR